jgi:hypothetical protein
LACAGRREIGLTNSPREQTTADNVPCVSL